MNKQLKKRILNALTQEAIAKKLGCRQQTISLWLKNGVPSGKVLVFSKALGWQVSPHELRPDLYPGCCDGLPDPMRGEFRKSKLSQSKEA